MTNKSKGKTILFSTIQRMIKGIDMQKVYTLQQTMGFPKQFEFFVKSSGNWKPLIGWNRQEIQGWIKANSSYVKRLEACA